LAALAWLGLVAAGLAADSESAIRLTTLGSGVEEIPPGFSSTDDVLRLADGRELPLDDLQKLEPVQPAAETSAPDPRAIEIRLSRGGAIRSKTFTLSNDVCTLTTADGAEWKVSIDDVRSVRFDESASESLSTMLSEPAVKDQLAVQVEESLSTLEAFIEEIGEETVSFEWMGKPRTLPRDKLKAVVFSAVGIEEELASRFTAHLADGSQVSAEQVASAADQPELLSLTISRSTTIAVPWKSLRGVSIRSNRVRYLSELKPPAVNERPIVALPRSWQADHTVTKGPLRAGDQPFEKGLGVQSGTTLTFDINGEWSSFQAIAALDPENPQGGDCEFVIRGDGRELLRERVKASDPPKPLVADVSGVTRLELAVEYGADLDFGDHANWCNASLIRASTP
jgi:hypothetical protein